MEDALKEFSIVERASIALAEWLRVGLPRFGGHGLE